MLRLIGRAEGVGRQRARGLLELDDGLVHCQAFAGLGQDGLDRAVGAGKEDVFHLHGFDNSHALARLHFLAGLHDHLHEQAGHG